MAKRKWYIGGAITAVVVGLTFFGQALLVIFAGALAILASWLGVILLLAYAVLAGLFVARAHVVRKSHAQLIRRAVLGDRQLRMYASLAIIATVTASLLWYMKG